MISEERIRELVLLGNENRNLDYKGAFSWDEASTDEKCAIAKDVLAFANTRDGGVILVGVNDKTGAPEGLTEEQFASFDQTKFNSFVHRYTDPRHTVSIHRMTLDARKLVAIDIPEFGDVPILCSRDAHSSSNQSKLILKRATLYKRTEKATSEAIEGADEMRELLNRGLLRRQDELLRAIKQIVLPNETTQTPELGAEFKAEIDDAERFFYGFEGNNLVKGAYWSLQLRPETYIVNRISSASQLQKLVQEAAISLRGWTFPIVGRVSAAVWTNFQGGSQSSFLGGETSAPEALRAYKSGLILWRRGMAEDYWYDSRIRGAVSFIALIYSVTEWVLFAKRFFEVILSIDDGIQIVVRSSGMEGRRLISADPGAPLFKDYQLTVSEFEIRENVVASALRADPEAIARRIMRRIFELFNWNDPDENMLQSWQQKLIRRDF